MQAVGSPMAVHNRDAYLCYTLHCELHFSWALLFRWQASISFVIGRDAMLELEMACDGGKDSLSMASNADGEVVKAPGNLVVSAYVGCPDITATVCKQ